MGRGAALAGRVDAPPAGQAMPLGTVRTFFYVRVMVDGLPVMGQSTQVWTGRDWLTLPDRPPELPIPKHQRRLE